VIASSTYARVWRRACVLGLTPRQVASPLGGRPYDRAGHSVDVLLNVYAKCIDGQAASVNDRIQRALRGQR
jgi:hypothetical protein